MKRMTLSFLALMVVIILVACKDEDVPTTLFDFEDGTIGSWTTTASEDVLISSDEFYVGTQRYMQSGQYFLTTKSVSDPITIESDTFVISGLGYLSFLIAGPSDSDNLYIALVDAQTNAIIETQENTLYDGIQITDNFVRIIWDVTEYLGKTVYLRVVDESVEGYILLDAVDTAISSEEVLAEYQTDVLLRQGIRTEDLLQSAEYYINLNKYRIDPAKRYTYHVMGEIGWINDPNGFVYFNDEYHLFYQHHPYSPLWGPMHWGHVRSDDLVKWEYLPIAVAPIVYDAGGGAAFSGSAIDVNGDLYIMYTENWIGYQHQVIAKSSDGIHFETINEGLPVIDENSLPWYANPVDFRDPKIWEKDDVYYAVIGSRQLNDFGQVVLFQSTDLTNWEYVGPVIQGSTNTLYTLGYMFECPDLFELEGQDVLIMSPQQIPGHRNNFGTVYVVGDLNYETGVLEGWSLANIKEIDYGFDFYAPQTMIDDQGRRIMIAWMQSWNRSPMTAGLGWAGAMTFPRELTLNNNNELIQYPIVELEGYRQNEVVINDVISGLQDTMVTGNTKDIIITFSPVNGATGITVFADETGTGTEIYYFDGFVYLDRTDSMGGRFPGDINNITKAPASLDENGQITLRILLDRHSVEVFVNQGEAAITSTVYFNPENNHFFVFSEESNTITGHIWDIIVE